MSETRVLSYTEIARLFDMTVPSARNLVRRRMWPKMPANDGKSIRVNVPVDALPAAGAPRDAAPDGPPDGSLSATLATLAKHIETLQAELEPLRAIALQVAALNAALDAAQGDASRLRDERDRLLTAMHLREQRRWWRRLAG